MTHIESKTSKKILLAVDGSEISLSTARVGIQLAKILSAEILGLHVIDEELVMNDYAEYQKELGTREGSLSRTEKAELSKRRGHEILEMLMSWCQDSGAHATTEIGLGGVGETVLMQGERATILAMGRRGNGHPDISDYLGKNFRYTAHRSRIPILAGGDGDEKIKKILLAYNGSPRAKKALQWAKQLRRQGSLEIIALVVQEDDEFSIRTLKYNVKSQFSRNGIQNFGWITRQGDAGERIAETAVKSGSNLIIMGGYRHKAILEWAEGSTLDSVLKKTPLPILIV